MEDDIEAKHALGQLQDVHLKENKIRIQEANSHGSPRVHGVTLLVKNVAPSVNARGLRNMFKRFGCVLEAKLRNGEGHVVSGTLEKFKVRFLLSRRINCDLI